MKNSKENALASEKSRCVVCFPCNNSLYALCFCVLWWFVMVQYLFVLSLGMFHLGCVLVRIHICFCSVIRE